MKTISVGLTCVFVTLKLVGHVTWSWFWVLCPIIFYIALGLVWFGLINAVEIRQRAKQIKVNRERQVAIDELSQRIKDLRDRVGGSSTKTVIIAFLVSLFMYACTPPL